MCRTCINITENLLETAQALEAGALQREDYTAAHNFRRAVYNLEDQIADLKAAGEREGWQPRHVRLVLVVPGEDGQD